jgi:hypothetical protein
MRKSLPESYLKFKEQFPDSLPFDGISVELFNESNIVFEQTNSAIAGGVEFTNHETFNPDKHLIIAAGIINDPWFIDATDPNSKIYKTLPSGEDGIWNVSCIANSLVDLSTILRNILELEKEMQHNPTRDMLDLYFDQIREAVCHADMEYWELFYAEGEWWVEHGYHI